MDDLKRADSEIATMDKLNNNIKNNIDDGGKLVDFDEGLFCALVDKVIVYKDRAEIKWRGEIDKV